MPNQRVFIADDDEALVNALAIRCRAIGLEVDAANDGLTALTSILFCTPDLVLLDLDMPCGNGLSVCDLITNDPVYGGIPIIVLTGKKDDETIRRCVALRARYVPKGGDVWRRVEPVIRELLAQQDGREPTADRPLSSRV
ncbi:MAG TPA: response regulator [Pirellulales bacterium]|nr:response regulator [Pirellulales bacterium]